MRGRGMEKMTSGQLQPGSQACSLVGEEQEAADWDEIFRSPHPQEVETDKQNEMLRCNYSGRPSMSPCRRQARALPRCPKQALGNEVLPDLPTPALPPPRQEPDSGSSSRPFSWQNRRMWKEQRAEPSLSSGCTGVRPQLPQPGNGAADPSTGKQDR